MRAQVDDHGPKRKWSFQAILSHSRPRLVPSFVSSFYRLDSVEVMMEKPTNLSPSRIEALPEGKHPDALVPGLCVIVSASGKRIWQFRRRVARSGKIVTLRLGGFPAHSIGAAREWASTLNEATERGVDPREERRIEKAMAMSVAEAHATYMGA